MIHFVWAGSILGCEGSVLEIRVNSYACVKQSQIVNCHYFGFAKEAYPLKNEYVQNFILIDILQKRSKTILQTNIKLSCAIVTPIPTPALLYGLVHFLFTSHENKTTLSQQF